MEPRELMDVDGTNIDPVLYLGSQASRHELVEALRERDGDSC